MAEDDTLGEALGPNPASDRAASRTTGGLVNQRVAAAQFIRSHC
jgi:hypothetical protein